MPNWCKCRLSVYGNNDARYDFKSFAKGEDELDYDKFDPYPEEYSKADKLYAEASAKGIPFDQRPLDGFNNGGYEWRLEHWGVKWKSGCNNVLEKSNSIVYFFETPWQPPIEIVLKMAKRFPDLRFHLAYHEPGAGIKGSLLIKGDSVERRT